VLTQLGAVCWADLAQAQSARLTHAAAATLTPTEQRIADLVAQGQTNAEIAAALLISPKTVECNLTRIYRKLGIRRRVDLARQDGS
jgi:DNA-binding CsgD family transcriptional regulator